MSKPKFDLSNVGGQPKSWSQKEHEKQLESSWWEDIWIPTAFFGLPLLLLACAGWVLYSLLKFAGKFN